MLRPGNAGSNTASDHIQATRLALAQLPRCLRRRVLIRADSGGGATPRTRSGARSWRWPATCSPGCRCSPSPAKPAAGNPDGCGCGSSPVPGASSAAAAACGSASPSAGPGPRRSPPQSPASRPSHPADQPKPSLRPERTPAGPWNPAHPARQPGRHADRPPKNGRKPQTQATQPRSRKMQARDQGSLGHSRADLRGSLIRSSDKGRALSHRGPPARRPIGFATRIAWRPGRSVMTRRRIFR